MADSKLASAYSRTISKNSEAWDAFPQEKKFCEITEPLCNEHIKMRNYYMARPYNFMMNLNQWTQVSNKIELLTAIRFGMEWDTNKLPDGNLADPAFHTQMYIKFHEYLMKNVMREAPKIVGEFQQAIFKARFMTTFAIDEIKDIRNLEKREDQIKAGYDKAKELKAQIDSINVIEATRDMFLINENAGPLTINREMFIKVFNQDFHPKMVDIMKEQRVYRGDPKNVMYAKFKTL